MLRRAAPRLWLKLARLWRRIRHRIAAVLTAHTAPEMIALGASVGVFAAVLPLPFLQIALAALLASLLGANRLAALTSVWLANPVFFYVDYKLGRFILKCAAPASTRASALTWSVFLSEMRESVFGLIRRMFLPMAIGSVVFGLACAAVCYPIVLRIVLYYRAHAGGVAGGVSRG
jgi:uncharacterized protein (DUF2062 family)